MTSASARRPSRWLAPVAILAVAGVAIAIARGGGSGDSDTTTTRSSSKSTSTTTKKTAKKPTKRIYVVRSGDTLSAISIETGVPVVRIQELNPDVDVQALQPGERLKLRR